MEPSVYWKDSGELMNVRILIRKKVKKQLLKSTQKNKKYKIKYFERWRRWIMVGYQWVGMQARYYLQVNSLHKILIIKGVCH